MTKSWRIFLSIVLLISSAHADEVQIAEIRNLDAVAKELKLKDFKGKKFTRKIKIAVLDVGFNGYEREIGKRLPENFDKEKQYHKGPATSVDNVPADQRSFHGAFMAILIHEILKKSGAELDYEIHLFDAFGYSKFADAVETVIRDGFDIVSYSQVWEMGGNGDSKGYINALVDKAVQAGVIWLNAAGNFGNLTRLAPVDGKVEGTDEYVVFKDKKGKAQDGVKIVCRPVITDPKTKKPEKTCDLKAVLSWNDFKNDAETGTDKDLDLILLDSKGNKVAIEYTDAQGKKQSATEKRQILKADTSVENASLLPREAIGTEVANRVQIKPGTYKLRVKIISKNFSASQDQLRITVANPGISMVEPDTDETILPPADNPGVITVGAADDLNSSKSKKLSLPSINLNSLVSLKDNTNTFSTSNATALAAAMTVLYLGTGTEKTRDAVLEKLKSIGKKPFEPKMKQGPAVAKDDESGAPTQRPRKRSRANGNLPEPIEEGQQGQQRPPPASGWPYGPHSPCQPGRLPSLYPQAQQMIQQGGAVPVRFHGRPAIVVSYDFARYVGRAPLPNERAFITPGGVLFLDARAAQGLPLDNYEVIPSPVCQR